jgi:hypothetical protein
VPDHTRGTAFGCITIAGIPFGSFEIPGLKNCLLLVPVSMYLMDDE